MNPPKTTAVIFDLDDTLIDTQAIYDETKSKIAKVIMREDIDMGEPEIIKKFETIGIRLFEKYRVRRERFTLTALKLYDILACHANSQTRITVKRIAESVFHKIPQAFSDTRSTLRLLRENGYRLGLFTEGPRDIQMRKVKLLGLHNYFQHISIVETKNILALKYLAKKLCGYDIASSIVYVGDSLSRDVSISKGCGFTTVWKVPRYDWLNNNGHKAHVKPNYTIRNLHELIPILNTLRSAELNVSFARTKVQ